MGLWGAHTPRRAPPPLLLPVKSREYSVIWANATAALVAVRPVKPNMRTMTAMKKSLMHTTTAMACMMRPALRMT